MIKNNVLELRKKNNWSRYRLSRVSGVPDPAIRRFEEQNYKEPSLNYIELLCKAFNCNVGDILEIEKGN